MVKHKKAHANVAGKWGRKIIYKELEYWGKKYAVAGCVPIRNLIPANIATAAALAPDKPSDVDIKIAKDAKKAMKYEKDYRKVKTEKNAGKYLPIARKPNARNPLRNFFPSNPFWSSNHSTPGKARPYHNALENSFLSALPPVRIKPTFLPAIRPCS